MKKFRIFTDFEEEEQFLNQMARKGYHLRKYNLFGIYTFSRSFPEDLNYKVDCHFFKGPSQYSNYLTFMEDAGWEHIAGTVRSSSQYFLPLSEKAEADGLFSDESSKKARYKMLLKSSLFWEFMMVCYFISFFQRSNFDLKSISYDQGFWQMASQIFWFSLRQVFPPLLFFTLGLIMLYKAIKVGISMKKQTNKADSLFSGGDEDEKI